jgi:hypothetical protein
MQTNISQNRWQGVHDVAPGFLGTGRTALAGFCFSLERGRGWHQNKRSSG